MSQFLHDADNDDVKAIAITRVFSENNRANNVKREVQHHSIIQSMSCDKKGSSKAKQRKIKKNNASFKATH